MRAYRRLNLAAIFLVMAAMGGPLKAQIAPPIPRLEHANGRYRFLVDGKPFLMLGGQAHNSSASNSKDLEIVYNSLVGLDANTAEVPLYWELIEPEPAKFDFHLIDAAIDGARQHHLRLIFLWFGTWKNGNMQYTPAWIKTDPKRYTRAINAFGLPMNVITPLCQACREADANAFAKVMAHIRDVDESQRTVIMMQVENETGLFGSDRDYSEQATRLFDGPVPAALMSYLSSHRSTLSPSLRAAWLQAGGRTSGTWTEVFGDLASEAFSAWSVARYVNAVAAAGKQVYPLPMYVNNWLINPGNLRAGEWPSGGPTPHVHDIWKAAAPQIDLLAPDIYLPEFKRTCEEFTRRDNPLFVPETRFSESYPAYAFLAFAQFNAIGFSPFGIDGAVQDGKLVERAIPLAETYQILRPLLPLIERLQYTGKLHAIIQNADWSQGIRLNHNLAVEVTFPSPYKLEGSWGRGILIELAPDDYIVAGSGFRADFRQMAGPPRDAEFLSIEEGTFQDGKWVTERRLNGDEMHVWLPEKGRILRAKLVP